jgi:hypothetical protein
MSRVLVTSRRPHRLLLMIAVVSLACVATVGAVSAQAVGKAAVVPKQSCGRVRALGTSFSVAVLEGHVRCTTARRVIEYVLTHGKPTQGSPGRSPSGWQCGYGYGFYHRNHEQSGRAGPNCSSGSTNVQGTQADYTLN